MQVAPVNQHKQHVDADIRDRHKFRLTARLSQECPTPVKDPGNHGRDVALLAPGLCLLRLGHVSQHLGLFVPQNPIIALFRFTAACRCPLPSVLFSEIPY